jgi:hypothetical protein
MRQNPVTIIPRRSLYYDDEAKQKGHTLSPQKYKPDTNIVQNKRFIDIGIGIGIGKKSWGKMTLNNIPGVGSYNLPSIFDKSRKYKYALN